MVTNIPYSPRELHLDAPMKKQRNIGLKLAFMHESLALTPKTHPYRDATN